MKNFSLKQTFGILFWTILAAAVCCLYFGVRPALAQNVAPVASALAAGAGAEQPAVPAPTEWIQFDACVINGNDVVITGANTGALSAADSQFYLFELYPYEDSIQGKEYTAKINKGQDVHFQLAHQAGSIGSRLYSKFIAAVWDGEKYVPVSDPIHITNPEVLAQNQNAFKEPLTKKGLLIELDMMNDAFNLGVKHVIVNIPFQFLLGSGIEYEYEGKTYHFNKELIEDYDKVIKGMTAKDLSVTAVILNRWNPNTPELFYPDVTPKDSVNYYMFNAATKVGYEEMKAIASFLTWHYSGIGNGKISNWIIGNEINNQEWNYIGEMDADQYIKEFERSFRVFYTAIKSTSANDRVYFSTDFHWMYDADNKLKYNAKDIIDKFNANVRRGGQMDWGLAYHPYSLPLNEPEFWDDHQTGLVNWTETSPVVNLANLSVLTDYFQKPEMLTASGEVRNIILSEQGFTSTSATRGAAEDLQAAAIAYAYYIVDSNPHIDAFIMSRQVDAPSEVALSGSFGLRTCDMTQPDRIVSTGTKKSYDVFKYIDKRGKTLEYSKFAKEIIGIDHWYDVIPDFKWRGLEMRTQP